jgi:GTP cyclohydrolase II
MSQAEDLFRSPLFQKIAEYIKSIYFSFLAFLQIGRKKLPHVERITVSHLHTEFDSPFIIGYHRKQFLRKAQCIMVLVEGDFWTSSWKNADPIVRVHSKCATSEVFGSNDCDCHAQITESMRIIHDNRAGVIIYLDQEARGNGLKAKLEILQYMEKHKVGPHEAWEKLNYPDRRSYEIAAAILEDLGLRKVKLLTNNPLKVRGLGEYGLIIERISLETLPTKHDFNYLLDKKREGHLLSSVG